jgi:hypothetical protein
MHVRDAKLALDHRFSKNFHQWILSNRNTCVQKLHDSGFTVNVTEFINPLKILNRVEDEELQQSYGSGDGTKFTEDLLKNMLQALPSILGLSRRRVKREIARNQIVPLSGRDKIMPVLPQELLRSIDVVNETIKHDVCDRKLLRQDKQTRRATKLKKKRKEKHRLNLERREQRREMNVQPQAVVDHSLIANMVQQRQLEAAERSVLLLQCDERVVREGRNTEKTKHRPKGVFRGRAHPRYSKETF